MEQTTDPRLIAYHEAGHAIAALVLGLHVHQVDLLPVNGRLGCCYYTPLEIPSTRLSIDCRKKIKQRLVVLMAGTVAQDKEMPGSACVPGTEGGVPIHGICPDWLNMRDLASLLSRAEEGIAKAIDRAAISAEAILHNHWKAVEATAEALLEYQVLKSGRLRRALKGKLPDYYLVP
jgi:ATP-dependent Zn protease